MVEFLSFLPDGKTVVSMSRHSIMQDKTRTVWTREKKVRLWDVNSGKEVRSVGNIMMDRVVLSPDARLLASGMNWIQIWEMETGKNLSQARPRRSPAASLQGDLSLIHRAFFPAGAFLKSARNSRLWQMHRKERNNPDQ
jgi:hypothetical protein